MNNTNQRPDTYGEILVVEDTSASLKYLVGILTSAGYNVRPVSDGELALRSIAAKHPDLILLDINLSGINGIDLCNQLKREFSTSNIPVIFISSMGDSELKVKALEAGGVDYVTKPFDQSEILARIKTHLNGYHLQQKLAERTQELIAEVEKHKHTGAKLNESKNNLVTLFNAMTDAIIEFDKNGNYIFIAPTSPELLLKPSKELLGKNLRDVLPEERAERDISFFRKCLQENKTLTMEYSLEIEGQTLWFEGRAAPKSIDSVLFIARDVTIRKKAEEELKKYQDHLEELVLERTLKLEEQKKELERLNILYVGREFRIKELRDELAKLKEQLDSP